MKLYFLIFIMQLQLDFFYLLNLIKIMELNYIGNNFIEIALFKLNNTSMDQMEDIYTKYNKWIY